MRSIPLLNVENNATDAKSILMYSELEHILQPPAHYIFTIAMQNGYGRTAAIFPGKSLPLSLSLSQSIELFN